MNDYFQFVAGALIGAFTSWIIAHEYYRKSRIDADTKSADLVVENEIHEVWNILTAKENIRNLDWRAPELIVGESLQIGVELGCGPTATGFERYLFVIEMEAPHTLSWGASPNDWDTKISLAQRPNGTRLVLTRKFWPLVSPWWVAVMDRVVPDKVMSHEALLREDMQRLQTPFRAL